MSGDQPVTVLIMGVGPTDTVYENPADDPIAKHRSSRSEIQDLSAESFGNSAMVAITFARSGDVLNGMFHAYTWVLFRQDPFAAIYLGDLDAKTSRKVPVLRWKSLGSKTQET
jgi:hypothetical protein